MGETWRRAPNKPRVRRRNKHRGTALRCQTTPLGFLLVFSECDACYCRGTQATWRIGAALYRARSRCNAASDPRPPERHTRTRI